MGEKAIAGDKAAKRRHLSVLNTVCPICEKIGLLFQVLLSAITFWRLRLNKSHEHYLIGCNFLFKIQSALVVTDDQLLSNETTSSIPYIRYWSRFTYCRTLTSFRLPLPIPPIPPDAEPTPGLASAWAFMPALTVSINIPDERTGE